MKIKTLSMGPSQGERHQGFRIYFVQNPGLKAIETASLAELA